MSNADTEHSKKLRAESARRSRQKALAEGRVKRKTIIAPADVMDEFMKHMNATGEKTYAKQLAAINRLLDRKK